MPHPLLLEAMRRQPAYTQLRAALPQAGSVLTVGGLAGSTPALLTASLATDLPNRLWLVVAATPTAAEAMEADLQALLEPSRVAIFPQREALP